MSAVNSLAYRRHELEIVEGRAPEKYLRLLPHITGRRILEIGAAEGVLSLLLADRDPDAAVTALELHPDRHFAALKLQMQWHTLGRRVSGCTMVCGDIRDRLDLLEGVDTLVAVRTIYHLLDSINDVFRAIAACVPNVVLCGNPNRARWSAEAPGSAKVDALGPYNFYAGVPGMVRVLETAGYTIDTIVHEGDPIVTGHR